MTTEQVGVGALLATGPTVYGDTKPLFMQPAVGDPNICYTAQDYRFMLSMMYPVTGIVREGDLTVLQHGNGDNTVDITAGSASIRGSTVTAQGNYFVYNPATKNIQPPTPPTVNPRIDSVILGIEDGQVTATHQYRWYIQVISGTEAATPVAPTLPTDCLLLATISRRVGVANILTADITNVAQRASNLGLASAVPSNNLNSITQSGWYKVPATGITNGPGAGGIAYVGYVDANNQSQIFVESSTTPRVWVRTKYNGTWGSWALLPAMPQGSNGSSNLSLANNGQGGMLTAPAIAGVCSINAGLDTLTALKAGLFSVSVSSYIVGNYAHGLFITVNGQQLRQMATLDWGDDRRAAIQWQGWLDQGGTCKVQVRNDAGSTRTITRACWLTYIGS